MAGIGLAPLVAKQPITPGEENMTGDRPGIGGRAADLPGLFSEVEAAPGNTGKDGAGTEPGVKTFLGFNFGVRKTGFGRGIGLSRYVGGVLILIQVLLSSLWRR